MKIKLVLGTALSLITIFNANAENSVATNGSTSMEIAIGSLGEAFTNTHKDIKFTYNPTGSSAGIQAALENRADIGLSSRYLKDTEKQNLNEDIIALDGIVLVVNKNNKIEDLSFENIKDIFTGKITNWKDVGGVDKPIVLIGREAGSGTRDGFESTTDTKNKAKYRQELTSTGDVITTVSTNENAIGYASFAANTKKVKVISVNKVIPTHKSIQDGTYKIQRPFVFVTKKDKELSLTVTKFIDFSKSKQGSDILNNVGVVAVSK